MTTRRGGQSSGTLYTEPQEALRRFMTPKRIGGIVLVVVLVFFSLTFVGNLSETVAADEIVVMQDPLDGGLHFWTQPGWYFQNFGKLTRYQKSEQYWFSDHKDEGVDESIKVRFNDGGHANLSGSLRFDMPLDEEHLRLIHTKYGSMVAIEKELIRTVVNKSVYMTGPLLTSKESYAEKRNYLIQFIEDQIINGVYRTEMEDKQVPDLLSGKEKTITVVKLIKDTNSPGGLSRQEKSLISDFGIKVYGVSLTNIAYDKDVEAQIATQQQAIMNVQTAIAQAKQAEQKTITAAKEGEALAAKAKWEQEVFKAKAVTQAEQEKEVAVTEAEQLRDVAKLGMEAADFTKKQNILLGEGEAARKRAVMTANGALEEKLRAWVEVQKAYAEVMKEQPLVPQIMMGTSGSGMGAANFMELMQIKAAKDLALDMGMGRGSFNKVSELEPKGQGRRPETAKR